jgi:thiamine pyrophosphate-dependent acetolactate synthase large subunit-like protein
MARKPEYGSDVVIDVLKALGVEYAAVNPGATFRGLHDSVVNYGDDKNPQMILANHEEIAVAVAHGYAKASGKLGVAMTHDIVGLLHASNAIYGAYLDQAPVMIMGGTGPLATEKRRPWIDWIHTALVQGNAVRDFVKWDDQPNSVPAAIDSTIRGYQIAMTEPRGPVYLCFDADIQEMPLGDRNITIPDVSRYQPPSPQGGDPAALRAAAEMLVAAERPCFVVDRVGEDDVAFKALIELAELLGIAMINPIPNRASILSFPATHPLDMMGNEKLVQSQADIVVNLEMFDISPMITTYDHHAQARDDQFVKLNFPPGCKYIDISLRHHRWRSWSQDYGMLLPTDLSITADVTVAVPQLLELCKALVAERPQVRERARRRTAELTEIHNKTRAAWLKEAESQAAESPLTPAWLAHELGEVVKNDDWVVTNGGLDGWARRLWPWEKPYQFVRTSGLGYGIGISVGAALAHKPEGRLVVDLQPDGDLLFTPAGLWTAAHHNVPLLVIMYNNRSYFNDELHQESMALGRGRPPENKVVGIRIDEPPPDFAMMARSFGVYGDGPIEDPTKVREAIAKAARYVREQGKPALVDVVCQRRRY